LLHAGPSIKTINHNGRFYTVFPERVTYAEAAATCRALPGGSLAALPDRATVDAVNRGLLNTLPIATAVKSAWIGAIGNNTQYDPAAPNLTAAARNMTTEQQQQQQLPPPKAKPGPGPEMTLRWADGSGVIPGLLKRLENLPVMWTVHDVVWGQQYVPPSVQRVCGRVFTQLPATGQSVGPEDVQPGVWFFDCNKPAAFICESKWGRYLGAR
jgi:hypothetical protein